MTNCITKFLIGGLSLTGILAIVFIVLYATKGGPNDPTQPQIEASARILSYMNQNADPCNDFWEYSCGGWIKDTVIPSSKGRLATFDTCDERVATVLKRELENTEVVSSIKSVEKAKTYYASCMDDDARDGNENFQDLKNLVADLGSWPIAGDKNFDDSKMYNSVENIANQLYKFAWNAGANSLFSVYTSVNEEEASNHIVAVDQPGLLLRTSYNYEQIITKKGYDCQGKDKENCQSIADAKNVYIDYLVEAAKAYCSLTNASCNPDLMMNEAKKVYELENKIASILTDEYARAGNAELTLNKVKLNEFHSDKKDVNSLIVSVINKIYEPTNYVEEDTIINDSSPDFFASFETIINDLISNSSAIRTTLQNMLIFRMIHPLMSTLPNVFIQAEDIYRLGIYGVTSREDRYITCTAMTENAMTFPVGNLYVSNAFAEESKEKISEMITLVESIFEGPILDDADWMDDETKVIAIEKAEQVADFIGYPDYIINDTPKMDQDYDDYNPKAKNLFENSLQASLRKYHLDIAAINEPVSRDRWSNGPAIVNAWYSPTRNTITFPAGILQSPFYDEGSSTAFNYGAIGTVIGHELTHGFDDNGRNYDGIGNRKNWWSDASAEAFKENGDCMANQYSSYYWDLAGLNVDGRSTLGENIADNGGIRESFYAYQDWLKNNKDVKLPGLDHITKNQQFFLGFSQVWCAKYTPEEARNRVLTDVHSPNPYRVQGPLSNFEEFGKAFGCKKGEDLYYPNDEDTCQVW